MSYPQNRQNVNDGGFKDPFEGATIVEDAPEMRSIAIRNRTPTLILPNDGAGKGSEMVSTFGAKAPSMPPPSFKSMKPPSMKAPVLGFAKPSLTGKFSMAEEWSGITEASVWDVKDDCLEMVPLDFPLERTHKEILEPASVVSRRISDVLKCLSIEAEYDCDKAKAKCKTTDYVGFRIRMYAGGEGGQPVIVEMQRRCGSASSFMKSCRAILAAAEGKKPEQRTMAPKPLPFMKKPIGQMKCLQSVVPATPAKDASRDALENVVEMMRCKELDRNILGLENLCALTDPFKTSPVVVTDVSKCILLGDEDYDLREEIRLMTERDMFHTDDELTASMTNRPDHFRHLALTIFANALTVCNKDGCLEKAVADQKWFTDSFVPSLLDEVKRAKSNVSNAYFASSCLQNLVASSPIARRYVTENDGIVILTDAAAIGKASHDLLASEANRCLELLGR